MSPNWRKALLNTVIDVRTEKDRLKREKSASGASHWTRLKQQLRRDIVRKLALFAGLPASAQDAIGTRCSLERFDSGRVLFERDDALDAHHAPRQCYVLC